MIPSRRRFCVAAVGGYGLGALGAGRVLASTSRTKKIYIVTYRGKTDVEKGFRAYLDENGYAVEYVERDLGRDRRRIPAIVAEIRALQPDLVMTWGTTVTEGIVGKYLSVDPRRHITGIPVLFTLVAAPVGSGLVPDLISSKRNITGVFHVAPTEAQIRALKVYRDCKRLGVLYSPTENNSLAILKELKELSSKMGLEVLDHPFQCDVAGNPTSVGVVESLREMKSRGAEWLYMPPDSFLGTLAESIVIPAAHELGLPTFASTAQIMDAGALAGLVSHYYDIGQFTAYKASQILFGNKLPSQIPIETLLRYSFVVRMAAAKQLKLLPPLALFNSAEFI